MGSFFRKRRKGFHAAYVPILLVIVSLACSLPNLPWQQPPSEEALPVSTPTLPPEPLPPALVESDPPDGAVVPLDSPFTLYFNQPMNRSSVEAAITTGISGHFTWLNDAALSFQPDTPLLPETEVVFDISVTAQSSRGMPLHRPASLRFTAAGPLLLTQVLPEDGQTDVNPSSAVVAAFNRPVVPLGADPASLPPAFTLEPAASGSGEWINTSTYIFYPDPPLAGGFTYQAQVNPELKSADGSPLQDPDAGWSFQPASPRVTGFEPQEPVDIALDTPVRIHFNQRMDPETTAAALRLLASSGQQVAGQASWDEAFTILTFTPDNILDRSQDYQLSLAPSAVNAAGIPLVEPFQVAWRTVGDLNLQDTHPAPNGGIETWDEVRLTFNAPLEKQDDYSPFIRLEPPITNLVVNLDQDTSTLHFRGDFIPNTSYELFIEPDLKDRWAQPLNQIVSLPFRTAPLRPSLQAPTSQTVMFLTPRDTGVRVQLTNLFNLPLSLQTLTPTDLVALTGPNGYELRRNFNSPDRQAWTASFDIEPDRSTIVKLPLNRDNAGLEPGIYLIGAGLGDDLTHISNFILVVSNVHLVYKVSASDVLVWALDTRSSQPIAGAPLVVYNEAGRELVRGQTGEDGIFRSGLPETISPFEATTVIMGQPGEELFSAAVSGWNMGLEPYNFGISSDYRGPGLRSYLYTDRPIYRPGQTVFFRGIFRMLNNGRYELPTETPIQPIQIFDSFGTELARYDMKLSGFGSIHGAYELVADSQPGYYRIESGENSVYFQVAEYRKPEINLQVNSSQDEILTGETLTAEVQARYFFDAPAGNVNLSWSLHEAPAYKSIPGYQVGLLDESWLYSQIRPDQFSTLGTLVDQGSATTNPEGTFLLEVDSTGVSKSLADRPRRLTLEVTAVDESGLPISSRRSVLVHPAPFYLGIRPDVWVGRAGQEVGYTVQVFDWEGLPAGSRPLKAVFRKVDYVRHEPPPDRPYDYPTFVPEYTEIAQVDFASGDDGTARLTFTAPQPGTYQLEVSSGDARSQALLWFGGEGQTVWPNLPNQRLRLTGDKETYQPGETAQVFIPNPFSSATTALVSIERGIVMRWETHILPPGGSSIPIPISAEDAPNVYLSTSLIGPDEQGQLDFRQGYLRLDVTPTQQTLNVSLTRQPERTGPGENVSLHLKVTDADGQPVQGEFSFAVVDLAALALAEPNSKEIVPAFYGQQPLGVWTNLALAAYANRRAFFEGGIGGGGGGEAASVIREDFPDTAYWNASVVTDEAGEASITLRLPDSLTTWQVDVRGLTPDTKVGQALTNVVTTKPVLVRPVTPRFLVAGDRVQLAAVVQNNTGTELSAQVSLEASGFSLDDGQANLRRVAVPAGGRTRVSWWGTAQAVENVDLVFTVLAGEYQDAARPVWGALPVLRYSVQQAFATAGYLEGAVQLLELVSLPPSVSYTAEPAGELRLELSPSLAASMLSSLDALEHYPYECTEQILAKFLPNLLLHQALQTFNIQLPEVQNRLERTLQPGLQKLYARQNGDGGWGWWRGDLSDPYLSAYVLFGLSQAHQAGVSVSSAVRQSVIDYLLAAGLTPEMVTEPFELDRLAFIQFSLAQAGVPDSSGAMSVYAHREQLSPWAQALLALALEAGQPGSPEAADLAAKLQTQAQRSATGAFWADSSPRWQNLNTNVTTTGMVVYALAQQDPASQLLPDAIRFLMANRSAQGTWRSTFETTWALLAATTYMRGTGELGGDFSFRATLNNTTLAGGEAGSDTRLTPVFASAPASSLYLEDANALRIERTEGSGRLYYTALLDVALPVDQVEPLNRGLAVERTHHLLEDCTRSACPEVSSAPAGKPVEVQLTLVVPQDVYYLIVEDYIPAGSEILDRNLLTSQLGYPEFEEIEPEPLFDPADPFADGWGWWFFSEPSIYDDRITWAASYLPAGTYQLTYTLTLLQAGEYQVIPARAYQFYFPDVQGTSAGESFTILP